MPENERLPQGDETRKKEGSCFSALGDLINKLAGWKQKQESHKPESETERYKRLSKEIEDRYQAQLSRLDPNSQTYEVDKASLDATRNEEYEHLDRWENL